MLEIEKHWRKLRFGMFLTAHLFVPTVAWQTSMKKTPPCGWNTAESPWVTTQQKPCSHVSRQVGPSWKKPVFVRCGHPEQKTWRGFPDFRCSKHSVGSRGRTDLCSSIASRVFLVVCPALGI
ncbi:unnamed protein product [Cladocopium goreaui]|uniref:Secreted protein n=1 Tax=Cladocopium goreaui TaxID=2562237 RepID=A0A9P1CQX8_9DINO|nr:unnamed protein product [Cladocopium goreaui]